MVIFVNRHNLRVKKYWLAGIIKDKTGHLNVFNITEPQAEKPTPIDQAYQELCLAWEMYPDIKKESLILPVWCLHAPTPMIESIQSLIMPKLPGFLARQISALELESPTAFSTKTPGFEKRCIGHSIVDFGSSRLLILGNVDEITKQVSLYGSRFVFPYDKPKELCNHLKKIFDSGQISLLGASTFMGGLGGIFSFGCALIISDLLKANLFSNDDIVLATIATIGSFILYVFEKIYFKRIFAFIFPWVINADIFSMTLFLGLLIIMPLIAFFSITYKFLWLLWIFGILHNISQIFSYSGCISYERYMGKIALYSIRFVFLLAFLPIVSKHIFFK